MLKKVLLAIVFVTVSIATYHFYAIGNANFKYGRAQESLNQWVKVGSIQNEESYFNALKNIEYAIAVDGKNPHYHHIKGRILDWGVYSQFDKTASFYDIKNAYLKALELRKTWPETWIDLAVVNSYIHGINEETLSYMEQAKHYGPYLWSVNYGIYQIYIENWQNLTVADKEILYIEFMRASHFKPHLVYKILTLAEHHGVSGFFCTPIKYTKDFTEIRVAGRVRSICEK